MKKILVTTPFFYPHMGGSQQYMEDLYITLLQKHPDIKVDVLCYNTDKTASFEKYKGLTIYRLPSINILVGKFALPSPLALWNFFSTHKDYDLVSASTRFFDLSWWALIYAKLTHKRIILIDHCAGTPSHKNLLISLLASLIDRFSGHAFLSFYDQIFVVSSATKDFLKTTFGVESKVLYGGAKLYSSNGVRSSRYRSNNNKRLKVIYAGRMIEAKGVLELVNVAKSMPEVDFILAGSGELADKLKGKLSNVQILGRLNKKELAKQFSQSDIFVYPTYHSEGIPLALLEAGASGLAVVASDIGGINEVIKDQQTGLLIKPKDQKSLKLALKRLIANSKLREKLAKNLSTHIKKNFSWEKTAEEFYKELI